ncbi:hypothetical protein GCM10007079_23980 [Nocardiopsis terrae]|uniref:CubicO group peptidase (Beta-lactamase class C family) n=1 Tax=Nocardiopsis terrae TaxID=372655 RepID=A0ABR9HGR0_9ACTN|nr:serine hydrolase domain-containing protein [Nocardiopsis terrae]MBE1457995.1 CubicO group peptidase (beta-lactamase class C family) [Nocardiopsis terrae]GHC83137.1 hypothetical protein GCM10007079_23980 [Nocardiopsis terrae]
MEQVTRAGGPVPDRPPSPVIDEGHWRGRLAELAERHGVPGAQLGILRTGPAPGGAGELVQVEHGVLNTGTGHPVTAGSVFQIGSITKVLTATLVMGLVDEGALTVDTRIAEVLPELRLAEPGPAAGLTVRHLLNHTSGIDGDVFTDTGRGDDVLERYVAELAGAVVIHPLGATFSYCNSGFPLLGRVVEKVTGLTWDEAMRERLFTPLGLTRTGTLPEEALLHGAALGHVVGLPDPYTLGDSWGLGWIRYGWDGHRLLGHDGNTIGQAAFLRLLPRAGLAVVLLTNGGQTRDLYQELYGEVFDAVAGVRIQEPLTPPREPSAATGTLPRSVYENASQRLEVLEDARGRVLRMTALGPLAELEPEPVRECPMVPVGPGRYAVRPGGQRTWAALTLYILATGEEYAHFGGRALPLVGGPGSGTP